MDPGEPVGGGGGRRVLSFTSSPDLRCAPLIVPAPRQIRVTAATDSVRSARLSASHARDGNGATAGEQAQQKTCASREERRERGDEGKREVFLRTRVFISDHVFQKLAAQSVFWLNLVKQQSVAKLIR